MPEYNEFGFDMEKKPYFFYAFLSKDGRRVKIGTVGREARFAERLAEVTRSCAEEGLQQVASIMVDDLNQHEADDTEAALRLWLTRAAGLVHYGRVDWLAVPEDRPTPDWQALFDRARAATLSWGR